MRHLVASFILLTGCAAASMQQYDASALTDEHQALFARAAAVWCMSSLRCCVFPGGSDVVVRYGIPSECIEHVGKPCAGYASEARGEIVLIPGATGMGYDHVMYGVMLHELGHICGCDHQKSGVMAQRVDGVDVEAAAKQCY